MVFGRQHTTRRAIFCFFLVLLAGGGAVYGAIYCAAYGSAQTPAKPSPAPPLPPASAPSPSKPDTQEPGPGAQVETGSVLGNEGERLLNRIGALFANHDFIEVQKLLDASDASQGPAKLTPEQSALYKGVLANRENKPQESIHLLEPLLAKVKSTDHPPEEKMLRKSLAEDYLHTGDWAKASQAYLELEYRFGGSMTQDERDEIELPVHLLPLAIANPPMTVEAGEPFVLPYDRDALGLTDVPVFVDAQSHDWMLDPTAPFNLVCRSTAKEIGLKVSEAAATVHTLTGRPMQVHMTVIPRFTVGTVTFRNMTAFVFDDADYYFPKSGYQVRGVLGFPAVSALGSLTVTQESQIEVQPGLGNGKGAAQGLTAGARFFLDGDQVMVALGKPGDERMYAVDAGGQQTYLTSRYYAEHSDEFAGKKMQLMAVPGARKRPPAPAYVTESVTLMAGDAPISLHYVQVLTEPLDAAAIDDSYGVLGLDALDELKSYTFDYRTMRFGVKNE